MSDELDFRKEIKNFAFGWLRFLIIIFNPIVFIVILCTLGLIYYQDHLVQSEQLGRAMIAIIAAVVSIFSGIAGGIISKRWLEITEQSVLVTRGKSAIRGLKLLLLNVSRTEKRTVAYLKAINEQDDTNQNVILARARFEEIIEQCNSLQEEALNAIEEWQDIIPEANIKTQIGLISELKGKQQQVAEQMLNIKKELDTTKEQSEEEKIKLREKLQKKEIELIDVRQELRKKQLEIGGSVFSVLNPSTISGEVGLGISPQSLKLVGPEPAFTFSEGSKFCAECKSFFSGDKCPCQNK